MMGFHGIGNNPMLGALAAGVGAVSDVAKNTELVTEYIVVISTSMKTLLVLEVDTGTDKAKVDEIMALISTTIKSRNG